MTFLLNKVKYTLLVIFSVICFTFILIHLIPGDPIDIMLGDSASFSDKSHLRKELRLDLPLSHQFQLYLIDLTHFNLGHSLHSSKPVLKLIYERLGATLELSFFTLSFSLFVGIPLGVYCAQKNGRWIDHLSRFGTNIGLSLPSFWLAPLLIYFFSVKLNLLPLSERGGFQHLILPVLTMSSGLVALIMQMTRSSMIEVIKEDFIRAARARGNSNFKIYYIHALSNSCFSLLTILGLILGSLLTGTVIIETIFDWPGIGLLLYESIQNRDYPVVQGCVLLISITYVVVNFLTDIIYSKLNPKVRLL